MLKLESIMPFYFYLLQCNAFFGSAGVHVLYVHFYLTISLAHPQFLFGFIFFSQFFCNMNFHTLVSIFFHLAFIALLMAKVGNACLVNTLHNLINPNE